MRMTGEQTIAAPRRVVWEALNDPGILRQCIPGCQSLEKDGESRFKAAAEIKIGPIGARFTGAVTLSDLDPPNGYRIEGEGQGGTAGFARGGARVRLEEAADGTRLSYDVEAQVGGRLAQLGGPIIDATARQLAAKFFSRFGGIVAAGESRAVPEQPQAAIPAPAAPPPARLPAAPAGLPIAWILAVAVAALAGFLAGRHQGGGGSDWMGLAIGLLVIVVAGAGFAFGRHAAAPILVLDPALLARLTESARR